jgi:hypothetical protein
MAAPWWPRRPQYRHRLQTFEQLLHERGLIQRQPGQARSITLLVPPEQLPPLQSIKIPATKY